MLTYACRLVMDNKQFSVSEYKIGDEKAVLRHFFVKQHIGNHDIKPSDRTLLVMNVPPYVNDKCLKLLYEDFGAIERIFFHKKPQSGADESEENSDSVFSNKKQIVGYKCAYIVFKKPSALAKALKCVELGIIPLDIIDPVGIDKFISVYKSNFIDIHKVRNEVEQFMTYYDQSFEEEKQKSKDMTVDEDGWITVTKHSKTPKIPRKEGVSERIIQKQKKALEKQTLLNFYRSQMRQQKEDKLDELRKKFEKDKKRIQLMQQNRKFKPY